MTPVPVAEGRELVRMERLKRFVQVMETGSRGERRQLLRSMGGGMIKDWGQWRLVKARPDLWEKARPRLMAAGA